MQMAESLPLVDLDGNLAFVGTMTHQASSLTDFFNMIIPVPVDTDMQETRLGPGRHDPIISFVIYTLIYSQLYHYGYVAFTRYSSGKDDVGKPPCGCSQHRRFSGRRQLSLPNMQS